MDEILEAIIRINEEMDDIQESTASFPSEDLPLDIWDKVDDTYKIKADLKANILDALSQYPEIPLLDVAKSIKVVGSIGTNLYDEDADIDIHIEPNSEFLEGKTEEDLAEIQRDVMNWFKNEREAKGWFVLNHPYEVYLQLNPIQDYFSDTVYDLMSDEWIKSPKKYDMSYNPYTQYGDIFTELDEAVAPADVLLGKIHRDVRDIKRLQDKNQEKTLKDQYDGIEQSILALKDCKEQWRLIRRRNSAEVPSELPEDPETLQHPDEWKRDNTIFKFLDQYKYFDVVNKLSNLLDDSDHLVLESVDQIPTILSEFYGS
jgi:hypothetical protein